LLGAGAGLSERGAGNFGNENNTIVALNKHGDILGEGEGFQGYTLEKEMLPILLLCFT